MADIPLQVISESTASERRITPSWSITQLRAKLEPITGIPPSSQRISLKTATQGTVPIEAADEDATPLSGFPLAAYAELHVGQTLMQVPLCYAVHEAVCLSASVDRSGHGVNLVTKCIQGGATWALEYSVFFCPPLRYRVAMVFCLIFPLSAFFSVSSFLKEQYLDR